MRSFLVALLLLALASPVADARARRSSSSSSRTKSVHVKAYTTKSGRGPIPVSEVTFAIFVTGYAIVDAIDRLPRGPKAGP